MPLGVEHPFCRGTEDEFGIPKPLMPLGVEHEQITNAYDEIMNS